jgi:hypothetical protein
VAVIAGDGLKPPTVAFSAPQVWWLSPVVVSLFAAIASIAPAALLGDQQFRSLWRSPKWVTGETLLLFGCGAAALAFGALVAVATAPMARPRSAPWPGLNDRSVKLLRRSSTALTAATVVGYAGFAVLIVRAGLDPLELFLGSQSDRYGMGVKDVVGTIPGVTTLTQFGIAAVVTSTILLVREHSRGELYKLLTVTGLALLRSYVFDERLAILELVVPITVILAGSLSLQHGWRRRSAQLIPFVSFVGTVVIFGTFEYFRSWTFYRTQVTTSYTEFALSRFAGYYATALNNGQLVLEHLQRPKRVPYDTIEFFWTAPGIAQMRLYETLDGHLPANTGEPDSAWFRVLNNFANPEFNNPSGYVGAFIDWGPFGGVLYFLVIGVISGLLYHGFRQAKPLGLFLYPVVFVGLLELPLLVYWPEGRATPAWIGLLIIVALVSKSEANDKRVAG